MRLRRSMLSLFIGLIVAVILASGSVAQAATTWKFTVKVLVPADLVMKYGGNSAMASKIDSQLATVSSRFSGFLAPINFKRVAYATYSGDAGAAADAPHPEANFALVYSESCPCGGWRGWSQSIVHSWPTDQDGVFAPYATDGLTHEFGHSRGAVDEWKMAVTSANNPVNGKSYTVPTSIMNYPYGVTSWDAYSVNIVNASGTTIYSGAPIVDKAFPPGFRVRVRNSAGVNVSGASVSVYPVSWNGVVQSAPVFTGKTNSYGLFKLPPNPFAPGTPDTPWNLKYPNFLVVATYNGRTGSSWMPLMPVGNWYFSHPGTIYTQAVKLN